MTDANAHSAPSAAPIAVDLLIDAWYVVTMNATRDIIHRGSVAVHDGAIVVTPVRRVRGGVDLGQLVREIQADYEPSESDWGPPAGREVW